METKVCMGCRQELAITEFRPSRHKNPKGICKHCDSSKEIKQRRERWNQGLCGICSKPVDRQGHTCQSCLEKIRNKNTERRRVNKRKSVDYLGGKCSKCGLVTEVMAIYEFHHPDPSVKEEVFSSNVMSSGWEKVKRKLSDVIVVCVNCHRIIHHELNLEDENICDW